MISSVKYKYSKNATYQFLCFNVLKTKPSNYGITYNLFIETVDLITM